MTQRVEGKVAIVTGAASGIGAATAALLAREGATVVVADLSADGAQHHAAALCAEGLDVHAATVDMGDAASVAALVDDAVARHGGLDILHNNALGLPRGHDAGVRGHERVHEADDAWFDAMLHATVTTTMVGIRHAIPHFRARGGGSIVNTASVAGTRGSEFNPAYGAGKAGVIQLTRSVAAMYGAEGIRCNAVCPGLILTPAAEAAFDPAQRAMFARQTPSPRLGRPDDVAHVVLFLASDESSFVNGQALVVDGGFSMHEPVWADRRA
jgi:NAD(P)-dependent dehydrogenase (short-subunit alcohol dehydrogenase family)